MAYDIEIVESAIVDFDALDARDQSQIRQAIEVHLRHEPQKVSKSRIKRLRDTRHPQFRLRVRDCRVFYDVDDTIQIVTILAIVSKTDAADWLANNAEWDQQQDDARPDQSDK